MNAWVASIGGGTALILFIVGVALLFYKPARSILKAVPLVGKLGVLVPIVLIALGLMAGGIAYGFAAVKGSTASISGPTEDVSTLPTANLQSCVYSAGTGIGGNVTVRQDPNSNNVVFLDVDESSWDTNGKAQSEVNITFKCARTGEISEDASVEIVAKGDVFKSETSTTDSSEYSVLQTTSRPSQFFPGKYTQTIYMDEGAQSAVTTADTKERTFLTFAEGEKELSVSLIGELDATSYANLNNYTQKNIIVSKRIGGQDTEVGRIIVNKIP